MCEHKIEDYTFVLYNIMFYDEKKNNYRKCDSLLCKKTGQCVCIDHEQTGLLRKLLSEEDQIVLPFDINQPFSLNLQNKSQEENLCQQAAGKLYRNRFFPEYEEKVCQLIEAYRISNLRLLDVIKALSVQYATNSVNTLEKRDSLLFLCRYASCSEKYLSILFRAIICRTIGCCKKAESSEEKEAYVRELVKSLNRLKTVLDQDDEKIIGQCFDGVNKFLDKWKCLESDSCKSLYMTIFQELMDYLEKLDDCSENLETNTEAGRLHQMYCLLKKILETADINTEDLPELPFAEYENAENIKTLYDEVIDILDHVKHNTDKLTKIWTILSRIFWSGEDIPTDEMEKMIHIAYY